MCTKLEIYAKSGRENEYYLEDNLRCKATSSMTLNNAMLFWYYKNVRQNVNDTITHGSDTITFTIPVYRKDTKNMTKAVSDLLEEFKERFGKYPNIAQFDEGKEFYNVGVRDLLTKNNIEYFSTNSERKAAIVER